MIGKKICMRTLLVRKYMKEQDIVMSKILNRKVKKVIFPNSPF